MFCLERNLSITLRSHQENSLRMRSLLNDLVWWTKIRNMCQGVFTGTTPTTMPVNSKFRVNNWDCFHTHRYVDSVSLQAATCRREAITPVGPSRWCTLSGVCWLTCLEMFGLKYNVVSYVHVHTSVYALSCSFRTLINFSNRNRVKDKKFNFIIECTYN